MGARSYPTHVASPTGSRQTPQSMPPDLTPAPGGRLALVGPPAAHEAAAELSQSLVTAFASSPARGLLHLATKELQTRLTPALEYVRSFACTYLTRLRQAQGYEATNDPPPTPPPSAAELATWVLQAPPLTGLEYLREEALAGWWADLDALVRGEIREHAGGAQAYLSAKNPLWRFVGRVTLHLAENKRDAENPFAFLATYVSRLTNGGRVQHEPLGRALQQYAAAGNTKALPAFLLPLQTPADPSPFLK